MGAFRTKRGTCTISHGELHLDESRLGQFRRCSEGARSSILEFVLATISFLYSVWSFVEILRDDRRLLPYLVGSVALLVGVAYAIDYLRGFRRPETVPLDAIAESKAISGSRWTHPRFIVRYESGGETKKRRIRLPSRRFSFTEGEFEDAKRLFRSHDIPLSGTSS